MPYLLTHSSPLTSCYPLKPQPSLSPSTLRGRGEGTEGKVGLPKAGGEGRRKKGVESDGLKGFATFWEFQLYRQKRSLIMNIIAFLLKKFIFILEPLISISKSHY